MDTLPSVPSSSRSVRWSWAGFLLLWGTLCLYGAIAAPVPGVNEAHYLGKAKHFWNPDWCGGDLLYQSANAHWVFYAVTGYWAHWLSLPQLAWVGRSVGYGLLACGWLRTQRVLGLTGLQAWWSLLGFLSLASWGNFSGEWLVGGIEGKVFSYGFLLLAFADWQTERTSRAALWAGLAISFHPVAGGWAVLAAMLAKGLDGLRNRQRFASSGVLAGVVLLIIAALPGLIPAFSLLITPDTEAVRLKATYLQVYYRLAHHLDPMTFPWRSVACYLGMLGVIVATRDSLPAGRTWRGLVCWSILFAAAGYLAGYGDRPVKTMPPLWRMSILKFYPFRLFDLIVPVTAAWQVVRWISNRSIGSRFFPSPLEGEGGRRPDEGERTGAKTSRDLVCSRDTPLTPTPSRGEGRLNFLRGFVCGLAFTLLLALMAGGFEWRNRFIKPTEFQTPGWADACDWIREQTPASALVQTPVNNPNFKWLAQRAEYVNYKDMPQDNASLVEWNRRMLFLKRWYQERRIDGSYSRDDLQELRAETGITHIVTDRLGPFDLPPCYTNDRFQVYDLTTLKN